MDAREGRQVCGEEQIVEQLRVVSRKHVAWEAGFARRTARLSLPLSCWVLISRSRGVGSLSSVDLTLARDGSRSSVLVAVTPSPFSVPSCGPLTEFLSSGMSPSPNSVRRGGVLLSCLAML